MVLPTWGIQGNSWTWTQSHSAHKHLYALAEEEKDYATREHLKWFVTEQVEEEENAQELIDKFTLIGDNGMGHYMLDQELAARVYTTPSPLANSAE